MEIQNLINEIIKFRDERDWEQFHNSKDFALALSVEASELIELFLWKTKGDIDKKRIAEELVDILIYTLLLVEKHGLDVNKIISSKLKLNEKKYPVEKSWGNSKKYNSL
jgi:NTP pyrophosphatase (non-canonical NTP hydrolase)